VFDSIADALLWLLTSAGFRAENLVWLFGDVRAEAAPEPPDTASNDYVLPLTRSTEDA
jgi:hypothetical protein